MSTGTLAGHNAVRYLLGQPTLVLPTETAIGDLIFYANYRLTTAEGRKVRHTFSGAKYFERMKEKGLYSTDNDTIKERIEKLGLKDIFDKELI